MGIKTHVFPRYSPDTNPLDFSFWKQVEDKVRATAPTKLETVDQYKTRLKKTALGMPRSVVGKAVDAMLDRGSGLDVAANHRLRQGERHH